MNPYIMFLCVFGRTCFMHDISLGLEKLLQWPSKVFFLNILEFRNGISVILQTLNDTTCLLMLPSLKKNPFISSSMEDFNSIQQVLHIPSFSLFS